MKKKDKPKTDRVVNSGDLVVSLEFLTSLQKRTQPFIDNLLEDREPEKKLTIVVDEEWILDSDGKLFLQGKLFIQGKCNSKNSFKFEVPKSQWAFANQN